MASSDLKPFKVRKARGDKTPELAKLAWWDLSALPQKTLFLRCLAGLVILFVVDLLTGSEVRLHVLYLFPLAMIALYCDDKRQTLWAYVACLVFQVATFSIQNFSGLMFVTDIVVASAASMLIVVLSAAARKARVRAIQDASSDELTGLCNRRAFMVALQREIALQTRHGGTFCVALLDLDGFKALNDSKGHITGDVALKLTANILKNTTRQTDLVARLGGDEFAVLMPHTPAEASQITGEKLRETLERVLNRAGFKLSASIGIAGFPTPPENPTAVLQLADMAMYRVKRSGKNSVAQIWPSETGAKTAGEEAVEA